MTAAVLSLFVLAALAPLAAGRLGARSGPLLALLPLAIALWLAGFVAPVAQGDVVVVRHAFVPQLGVELSFRLDGLSLLFALLITGMGGLILVYAGGYLADDPRLGRLEACLLSFMGAMLGLVLSENLLSLFVFWELTSVSSFLLIGHEHERPEARRAALQALLVTGAGGLALLAGVILIGRAAGSFELSRVLASGDVLRSHPLYGWMLGLVLVGCFTKSAQAPFHFWLPGAMAAPTPVSAYLHSATMVKAGVFLLARLQPALGRTSAWETALVTVGGVTLLVGASLALAQTDLKRILAYTTVAALGMLVLLIGVEEPDATKAALLFVIVHALYKGALFMVAGAVDHEAGTREIGSLGGLAKAMPITACAAAVAALSMAGAPPLAGFVAKEIAYKATLGTIAGGALFLGNVLTVAAAGLVSIRVFLGAAGPTPRTPHEAPPSLWLPPAVLATLGLVAGLQVTPLGDAIVAPAVEASLGLPHPVALKLWAGLRGEAGLALAMSALTLATGLGVYAARASTARFARRLAPLGALGPERMYDRALAGLLSLAKGQTALLQSGRLRRYVLVTLLAAGLSVGAALAGAPVAIPPGALDVRPIELAVALVVLGGVATTLAARSRLTAVIALGAVGFGVSFVFLLFGAPDLAMTQFAVETLSVILFMLVLYRLPKFAKLSRRRSRVRDGAVAAAFGLLMTTLVLAALTHPSASAVKRFFAGASVPLAHGRNVVNVILVDFRALDTLGEITVLGAAAIGVHALLRLRPRGEED